MPKRPKKNGRVRIGPSKPKVVAKVRRTQTQAYGTLTDWFAICAVVKKRDGNKCRKCSSTSFIQVDHIIPVAKGGRTIISNLWCLCDLCHSKRPGHKKAKSLILHKRNKSKKT